eukprot:209961-Pyramimonas_sp.AAC.1
MISVPKSVWLKGFRILRVQQLRSFAVLKYQELCSDAIHDRQDATVRLIRGVGVPKTLIWHASGSSTVVFHRGSSLSGNEPL